VERNEDQKIKKDWDLTEKVSRDRATVIDNIVKRNEITKE
jgi:hypothetical protein